MAGLRAGAVVALIRVLDIEPDSYRPSALHGDDRLWQETNCYADAWIELLHALDLDPVAALAFTLSTDFDDDQWRFFKFPSSDLRRLFGLEVMEMNPWRGPEHHVEEQLGLGRFMTVEVDSFFLPDTAGTSYRRDHVKTTIVANMIDRTGRRLAYFHNAGYHELAEDDYAGVFRHHLTEQPEVLAPYAELVRTERLRRPDPDELLSETCELVRAHLARRPTENPIAALRKRIEGDADWLRSGDMELFHQYAFATVRQLGANAELAASLCSWLADRDEPTTTASEAFIALSAGAKTVQFKLARLIAGRATDLNPMFNEMEHAYDRAMSSLADRYGR